MTGGSRDGSPALLVAALAAAAFSYGLMQSLITPILPTISAHYVLDPSATAWLVTGFLVAACVATPIIGRLGDMFRRSLWLRVTMVVFTAGTLLAALAPSFDVLVLARVVQGVGGALFPLAFGIVRERVPPPRVPAAVGLLSSIIAVGSGVGIVAAGPLVEGSDHRAVFWVSTVIAAAATLGTFLAVPRSPTGTGGRVDLGGAALMSVWLVALLLGIERAFGGSGLGIHPAVLGVAGGIAFLAWIAVEHRAAVPIIALRLLARPLVRTANLLALAFGYLLFAPIVVLPSYLQSGAGLALGVSAAALLLLPQTAMFFVVSVLSGPIARWPGPRAAMVIGAAVTVAGAALLVLAHAFVLWIVVATSAMGFGIGLIYAQLTSTLVSALPAGEIGSVTGMNTNIRNIGGAFGAQLSAALILSVGGDAGYTAAFAGVALVAVAGLVAALALARALTPGR